MSVYDEKKRDVRALDWFPGRVMDPGWVTYLFQFYLPVSHKQIQRIFRMYDLFQSDFYVTNKISGVTQVGVKHRTV